jgi:hypothetical protein
MRDVELEGGVKLGSEQDLAKGKAYTLWHAERLLHNDREISKYIQPLLSNGS